MMALYRAIRLRLWLVALAILPFAIAACNNKGGGGGY
jgi:predicted small lipoprotein YifL